MKTWKVAILVTVLLLLVGCTSVNPLLGPFDTAMNTTLGPYIENRLEAELGAGTKDIDFVRAKQLELQALRALILEAKGEANVE